MSATSPEKVKVVKELARPEIVFAAGPQAADAAGSSSAARTSRSTTSTWTRTSPSRRSWAVTTAT